MHSCEHQLCVPIDPSRCSLSHMQAGVLHQDKTHASDIPLTYRLRSDLAKRRCREFGDSQSGDRSGYTSMAIEDRGASIGGTFPSYELCFSSKHTGLVASKSALERQSSHSSILHLPKEHDCGARPRSRFVSRWEHRGGVLIIVTTSYVVLSSPARVQWHHGPAQPVLDGFTIRRTGDKPTKIRLVMYLQQQPQQYKVHPDLGMLRAMLTFLRFYR